MRRRAALLVPLLLLTACAHAGARTAAATRANTPRNYEVGVCGRGLAIANIGGRNQDGEFTHTPNLRLAGGKRSCGIQPRWWFRPGQILEINARGANGEWRRVFRAIDKCAVRDGRTDRRWCEI